MIKINNNGIKAADFVVTLCQGSNPRTAKGVPQHLQHFRGAMRNTQSDGETHDVHYYVVTFLQVAVIPRFMKSQERYEFLAKILAQVALEVKVDPALLEAVQVGQAWVEDELWAAMMKWEENHREIVFNRQTLRYFQWGIDGTETWVGEPSHATRLSKAVRYAVEHGDPVKLPEDCEWITLTDYTFDGMPKDSTQGRSFMYKPRDRF